MVDFSVMIGDAVGGLIGPFIWLIVLAVVGLGIGILYLSGIMTKRPYRIIELVPRANGLVDMIVAKARKLENNKGQAEIFYGAFSKRIVNVWKEDYVGINNTVWGTAINDKEMQWIDKVNVDNEVKAHAAVTEGRQLNFAVGWQAAWDRFKNEKAWMQYLPLLSIIIAALLFGGGLFLAANMIKDSMNSYSASNAQIAQAISSTFANATIIKQVSTTDNISNSLPKGYPAG